MSYTYRPTDLFLLKGVWQFLISNMIVIFPLSIPSKVILVVLAQVTTGKNLGQNKCSVLRVSVQGVESLWGDCRFIPAD